MPVHGRYPSNVYAARTLQEYPFLQLAWYRPGNPTGAHAIWRHPMIHWIRTRQWKPSVPPQHPKARRSSAYEVLHFGARRLFCSFHLLHFRSLGIVHLCTCKPHSYQRYHTISDSWAHGCSSSHSMRSFPMAVVVCGAGPLLRILGGNGVPYMKRYFWTLYTVVWQTWNFFGYCLRAPMKEQLTNDFVADTGRKWRAGHISKHQVEPKRNIPRNHDGKAYREQDNRFR